MKTKTTYICRECGYKSPKWLGKCPSCNQWNTMEETLVSDSKNVRTQLAQPIGGAVSTPKRIHEVKIGYETRYSTGMKELDRVLGGGIVQ